jgi:NTP pyrophosphatase (non-canonical NTP hydrolase)
MTEVIHTVQVELQEAIVEWFRENIKDRSTPAGVMEKLSDEVLELEAAVALFQATKSAPDFQEMAVEAADCLIALLGVIEMLNIPISYFADGKLGILKQRTWTEVRPGYLQHDA